MRIPSSAVGFALAVFLTGSLFTSCTAPAESRAAAVVRLDESLAARIAQANIELTVIAHDPNLIWCEVNLQPDYGAIDEQVGQFALALDSLAVARAALETGHEAALNALPPGKYWVTTAGLVTVGDERLWWSLPLEIDSLATSPQILIMHRSNAAMVLGPENTGF
jgi:hypothetical protein